MSDEYHPSEVINKKRTLARRERDAGLEPPAPKQEPKGDMPQTQFTRPLPPDPEKKKRQDEQFKALMRKQAEEDAKRKAEEPVQKLSKGGVTRGDGCAQRGHTKGKMR